MYSGVVAWHALCRHYLQQLDFPDNVSRGTLTLYCRIHIRNIIYTDFFNAVFVEKLFLRIGLMYIIIFACLLSFNLCFKDFMTWFVIKTNILLASKIKILVNDIWLKRFCLLSKIYPLIYFILVGQKPKNLMTRFWNISPPDPYAPRKILT